MHERAARIVYGDYETCFSDLLIKDGGFTAHHANDETLLLEMYI